MQARCIRHLVSAVAVIALAAGAAVGTAAQPAPITAAAEKTGWWIRINPANHATHVYWRFGAATAQLSAPVTWIQGQSPQDVDVPAEQRTLEQMHVAALGMPPASPVSFCLFFQDRGVALVEFTQERNLDIDRNQTAPECVP
jgi:hypothetical protein